MAMTNEEVFRAFVNRMPAKGGSVRVERTTDGVVLYSYATPIAAYRDGGDLPVFTTRKFSVTTSKQQSQARRIAKAYYDVDDSDFRIFARNVGASFALAR